MKPWDPEKPRLADAAPSGQHHFDLHRLHAENTRLRAALARAIKELVGTTAHGGDAELIMRSALNQGEKP